MVELLRKIAITGAVLLIPNTNIMQRTLTGCLISLSYTTMLLSLKPYKDGVENLLAIGSAVLMNVSLLTTLLMKLCDLSTDTCDSLGFDSSSQISIVFLIVGIVILLVLVRAAGVQ